MVPLDEIFLSLVPSNNQSDVKLIQVLGGKMTAKQWSEIRRRLLLNVKISSRYVITIIMDHYFKFTLHELAEQLNMNRERVQKRLFRFLVSMEIGCIRLLNCEASLLYEKSIFCFSLMNVSSCIKEKDQLCLSSSSEESLQSDIGSSLIKNHSTPKARRSLKYLVETTMDVDSQLVDDDDSMQMQVVEIDGYPPLIELPEIEVDLSVIFGKIENAKIDKITMLEEATGIAMLEYDEGQIGVAADNIEQQITEFMGEMGEGQPEEEANIANGQVQPEIQPQPDVIQAPRKKRRRRNLWDDDREFKIYIRKPKDLAAIEEVQEEIAASFPVVQQQLEEITDQPILHEREPEMAQPLLEAEETILPDTASTMAPKEGDSFLFQPPKETEITPAKLEVVAEVHEEPSIRPEIQIHTPHDPIITSTQAGQFERLFEDEHGLIVPFYRGPAISTPIEGHPHQLDQLSLSDIGRIDDSIRYDMSQFPVRLDQSIQVVEQTENQPPKPTIKKTPRKYKIVDYGVFFDKTDVKKRRKRKYKKHEQQPEEIVIKGVQNLPEEGGNNDFIPPEVEVEERKVHRLTTDEVYYLIHEIDKYGRIEDRVIKIFTFENESGWFTFSNLCPAGQHNKFRASTIFSTLIMLLSEGKIKMFQEKNNFNNDTLFIKIKNQH